MCDVDDAHPKPKLESGDEDKVEGAEVEQELYVGLSDEAIDGSSGDASVEEQGANTFGPVDNVDEKTKRQLWQRVTPAPPE